jgi:cell division protein FtsL
VLETINGFDLLLVIVIVALVFKAINLNDECNSYVQQIIEVSQDNYKLTQQVRQLNLDVERWDVPF